MRVNFKAVCAGSLAACATLITIVAVLYAQPAAGAQPPAAADPAVIPAWNAIAVSTITGPSPNGAGKANVETFLWFAFVQAAVYNAVNGITGEYELYEWNANAMRESWCRASRDRLGRPV
jgi:CDP-diglyceride synthetase